VQHTNSRKTQTESKQRIGKGHIIHATYLKSRKEYSCNYELSLLLIHLEEGSGETQGHIEVEVSAKKREVQELFMP
jgi:hypothetical protein